MGGGHQLLITIPTLHVISTSDMTNPDDSRRVYLLCRPIFSGNNAHIRRHKKIKELLNKSKEPLRPLLEDIGEERLIEIVRSLLECRIFASELRAKVEFPDLFRPSPSRDAQRQASEIDAARSTAEALDEIASRNGGEEDVDVSADEDIEEALGTIEDLEPQPSVPMKKQALGDKIPSLYPSYLPYQTQHLILNMAQQVLEECCFDFATTSMSSILKQKKWECSSAVELTKWIKIFRKKEGKVHLPPLPPEIDSDTLGVILAKVSDLRHTAVHRLPTTAKGISRLLEHAVKFAQILQDTVRAAQLDDMRSALDSQIQAMELNKNALEDMATVELLEIQRQREELDRREAALIDGMLKDDLENKALVGQLLEDNARGIFHGGNNVLSRSHAKVDVPSPKGESSRTKGTEDMSKNDGSNSCKEVQGNQTNGSSGHDDEDEQDERTEWANKNLEFIKAILEN